VREPLRGDAGSRETGDDPGPNDVIADGPKDVIADYDNGDRLRRLLGYSGREIAERNNDVRLQAHQFGGKLGMLFGTSLSVAKLDGDVPAINETQRAQPLSKRLHAG